MEHDRIKKFFIPESSNYEVNADYDLQTIDEHYIRRKMYHIHMTHWNNGTLKLNLGQIIDEFQSRLVTSKYEHVKSGGACVLPRLISNINGIIDRYNSSVDKGLKAYHEVMRFNKKLQLVEEKHLDEEITRCVMAGKQAVSDLTPIIEGLEVSNEKKALINIKNFHSTQLSSLISKCNDRVEQYKDIIGDMRDEAETRLKELMEPEVNQSIPENFKSIKDQISLVNTKVLNTVFGCVNHNNHSLEDAYAKYPQALNRLAIEKKNKHTMLASLSLFFALSLVIAGMACLAYYSSPTLPTEYLVLGVTFSSLGLIGILGAYYYNNRCAQTSYNFDEQNKLKAGNLNSNLSDSLVHAGLPTGNSSLDADNNNTPQNSS